MAKWLKMKLFLNITNFLYVPRFSVFRVIKAYKNLPYATIVPNFHYVTNVNQKEVIILMSAI